MSGRTLPIAVKCLSLCVTFSFFASTRNFVEARDNREPPYLVLINDLGSLHRCISGPIYMRFPHSNHPLEARMLLGLYSTPLFHFPCVSGENANSSQSANGWDAPRQFFFISFCHVEFFFLVIIIATVLDISLFFCKLQQMFPIFGTSILM